MSTGGAVRLLSRLGMADARFFMPNRSPRGPRNWSVGSTFRPPFDHLRRSAARYRWRDASAFSTLRHVPCLNRELVRALLVCFPLRVTFRPPSQRQTASWTLSQPRPVEPSGLGGVHEAAEPRSNTRLSAGGKRIQKTDLPLRSRFQQRRKLLSRGLRLHEMVFETGCRWVEKPVTTVHI